MNTEWHLKHKGGNITYESLVWLTKKKSGNSCTNQQLGDHYSSWIVVYSYFIVFDRVVLHKHKVP